MIKEPADRVSRRFVLNVNRVKSLIILFELISELATRNKKKSQNEDLLRSAVVFMHASLEDLLREAIRVKLPLEKSDFAKTLCLETDGTSANSKEKFTISDLISRKTESVDSLIEKSINGHLDRRNFNHIQDVVIALKLIDVDPDPLRQFFPQMTEAIKRRHNIVHQSDRASHDDTTHGIPEAITKASVSDWLKAVESFGSGLLTSIGAAPITKPLPPKRQTKKS